MGAPIQIRVYDNEISVWNDGGLPEGITEVDDNQSVISGNKDDAFEKLHKFSCCVGITACSCQ